MAQDVVADEMRRPGAECFQPVQCGVECGPFLNQSPFAPHRRKGKKPRRFRINLQINRNASCKEKGGVKGQTSGIRIPRANLGFLAIDNLVTGIR